MVSVSHGREFAKRIYADLSDKNVSLMAGGLAYSAFLSLAPLLILLFFVLSVLGTGLEARIVEFANQWLPGPIADVVQQIFLERSGGGSASAVGVVVLLWGALRIFRGLDTAFSEIYETGGDSSFVDKLKDGIVVFFALGVAVVATVGTGAAFAVFSDVIPFSGYAMPLVILAGLVVAFLPMYYVFPDRDVSVREVLPGAVFAAVGWAAFQGLFQVYLTFSEPGTGSFAGSIIILITYLYFSAFVLLLGAVINAEIGGHSTDQASGVGERVRPHHAQHEASLDRAEVDAYLRGLNERLATTSDGAESDNRALVPGPEGNVHLVEYTVDEGERSRRTVKLSWITTTESTSGDSEGTVIYPTDN